MGIFGRNTKNNQVEREEVVVNDQPELSTEEFLEARRLVGSRSSVNHATSGRKIRGLQQTALIAKETEREYGWMYQD